MRSRDVDHVRTGHVSSAVARVYVMMLAVLLLGAGACGGKDKKDSKSPGSTGQVTTEGTELMGEGTSVPEGEAGDTDTGDRGEGGAGSGDASAGGKGATEPPKPPKIEPPDLDVGAAAQNERVEQHLRTARNALSGASKDPDAAIREARSALAVDATSIDAVVLIAHAYHAKRLYDTAEVTLDMMFKSRKKARSHAGVFYVYGLIYDHTKRPEQAMVAYQKAVELKPDYNSALVNLGVHYLRNRNYDQAISIYEKLTGERGLANAVTYTNLGSAYRGRSGDYPTDSASRNELLRKAEIAYKHALSVNRNYGPVYYNLGLLYLDADPLPAPDGTLMDTLKRLERAKTYFDEYRAMSGADIDLVAERLKQTDKLIKREQKARDRTKNKKKSGDDDW
jgi:tetratricopeptide (TPR) repeat protein